MKHAVTFVALLSLSGAASFANAAPKPVENPKAVFPVPRRLDALKSATQLLAPHTAVWSKNAPALPDPFFRSNTADAKAGSTDAVAAQPSTRSDLDVLRSVAPQIRPTGTMLIGDEPYLLIGGRRLKVGDQITVTFDGGVYQVGLSSIERNSYTLRLNDQELQCEFK